MHGRVPSLSYKRAVLPAALVIVSYYTSFKTMSAALQSALTTIQQNDYLTLAAIIAAAYDYVLTFSKEIEYIWSKPWTWVSTLFILVRYVGLCNLVGFIPGPAKMYVFILPSSSGVLNTTDVCRIVVSEIIDVINSWTFILFFGSADFVMILRVWAMYNQSRLILGTLLTTFSLEIIITVAITLVCMLAIIQFVRQSLQMYRVTKQWQLNQYMHLLVKQGVFYFLAYVSVPILSHRILRWPLIPLFILETVPVYTLGPRFIISIRELYARDVQGRRGSGIDTGFGLSLSSHGAEETGVVFADVEWNEGMEDVDEVQREVGSTQPE
ncbi:hypothetical protein EV363DRAFT_1435185 [Boletus edulis]|nr:hypothetical protein EV363DRAFT_1435185 [Boletus edulis]